MVEDWRRWVDGGVHDGGRGWGLVGGGLVVLVILANGIDWLIMKYEMVEEGL